MTNPPTGIDALIQKYCVLWRPRDARPGEMVPEQNTVAAMGNHRTEAFIDGMAYFEAIDEEIQYLIDNKSASNRFFYLSAWMLGLVDVEKKLTISNSWKYDLSMKALRLPSRRLLLDRLVELDQSGVDVRVLAWVSPFVGHKLVASRGSLADINFRTLLSVWELRQKLPRDRVMLNMLAHSMGAAHCKLVICGDSSRMRAYTSGLDPVRSRMFPPVLEQVTVTNPKTNEEEQRVDGGWHDLGVRVEGAAAASIHDFFAAMWNEQRARPVETFQVDASVIVSHDPSWPPINKRPPINLKPGTGKQYVQVLRTVPQMNFNQAGPLRRGALLFPTYVKPAQVVIGTYVNQRGFRRPRISFAPNGIFEFKLALQHAIAAAERYIFIADQALFGFPIMDWINRRKQAKPELQVILLYGVDPADEPTSFLPEAINRHLVSGVQQEQIRTAPGVVEFRPRNIVFAEWYKSVVHAKVVIIDDVWCSIGSANCMRRSLFTDIELSLSICEQPTPPSSLPTTWAEEQAPVRSGKRAPSFIQRLRRDLWAHYCGISLDPRQRTGAKVNQYTALLSLDRALTIWDHRWGTPIPGLSLSSYRQHSKAFMGADGDGLKEGDFFKEIMLRPVPLAEPKRPFHQGEYNRYDADSTQRF